MSTPTTYSAEIKPVCIGVTGHRSLHSPEKIEESVQDVLACLDALYHWQPHWFRVFSSLAEGSDQLVARVVLDRKGDKEQRPGAGELVAVLPMPEEMYFETFDKGRRVESVQHFQELKKRAADIILIPETPYPRIAYEEAGRFVVDHCEYMIAIWDGKESRGRGGTAEILKYACSKKRQVICVKSDSGDIVWLGRDNDYGRQLSHLREYLGEFADERAIRNEATRRYEKMKEHAKSAKLDEGLITPLAALVVPEIARASLLAQRYQTHFKTRGFVAYVIAAGSATAAAIGSIWTWRPAYGLEMILIVLTVVFVWPSVFRNSQRKWIEYRFLAERLRASSFEYAVGVGPGPEEHPPDLRISWVPVDWATIVLDEIWKTLPPRESRASEPKDEEQIRSLVRFLDSAWLRHQVLYYLTAGETNDVLQNLAELALKALVVSTFVTAVVHVFWGGMLNEEKLKWVSLAAIGLPALAGACAAICAFLHFHRNAERYKSMSQFLAKIRDQILECAGLNQERMEALPDPTKSWLLRILGVFASINRLFEPHDDARKSQPPNERLQNINELVEKCGRLGEGEPGVEAVTGNIRHLVRQAADAMTHEHEGWTVVFGVKLPGPG
jgi:hypothetical protein